MLLESFIPGVLEMSSEPLSDVALAFDWSSVLTNRIRVTASVFILLLMLGDLFKLMPALFYSVGRSRGIASLEYNISISRMRDRFAALCILPFCLIVDRFSLYDPAFLAPLAPEWKTPATIGVMVTYLCLRLVGSAIFCPRHLGRDAVVSARKCAYTFFILLCFLMILSTALLSVFSVPEHTVRIVLYSEIALFFPCSMVRTAQFLSGQCSNLATFLYLCGLELLPAALLLLSTLI